MSEIPVNPKGHFANERTFLHWLSMNLALGGLGIGLVNFGNDFGQVSGLIFVMISMIFSFYALIQYHKRANLLSKKLKGLEYEDFSGILAMVLVVFLAVLINFGFTFTN